MKARIRFEAWGYADRANYRPYDRQARYGGRWPYWAQRAYQIGYYNAAMAGEGA